MISVALVGLAAARWWWPRAAGERAREAAAGSDPALVALAARGHVLALDEPAARLAWQAPTPCVERYRFEARASVAGQLAQVRAWDLTLAEVDGRPEARMVELETETETETETEIPDTARVRELWFEAGGVGPAAPDLACRLGVRDPIEDVLAFAWPALPATSVDVGTSWTGRSVEGWCHRAACSLAPGPGCRAPPWHEQLVGAGDSVALVQGRWQLGSDPEAGGAAILTSRSLVIADGRPLYGLGTVDSKPSAARLELSLVRLDDCPPPPQVSALARVRARLRAFAGKSRRPHT